MVKRILMPVDGSQLSERVQGWVTGLAKPLDAEIVLLTVVNPDEIHLPEASAARERPAVHAPYDRTPESGRAYLGPAVIGMVTPAIGTGHEPEHPPMFGTQVIDHSVELATRYLTHLLGQLQSEGYRATMAVAVGDPAVQIVKAANDEQVDVLAMATHRESILARGILGSVTDRVLHASPVPVLVIRPRDEAGMEPHTPRFVIVPLDGSSLAESAVPVATEIAESIGAEMEFVRVVSTPYYAAAASTGIYYASPLSIEELRDLAREYLEPFVETAEARGLAVTARTPTGSAAGSIVTIAGEREDTLVVMATHGASGLKRWILGSVTDKVVRASHQPVLVVPQKTG